MKVASTLDLKNKTNQLLRTVKNGEAVIITYRGKPAASLTALSEDDLEDFVLEQSPKIRRLLAEAEADRKAGRVLPLKANVARTSAHNAKVLSQSSTPRSTRPRA